MKKARKVREAKPQKVRLEIVQPQTAMIPLPQQQVVPVQETVEAALEAARHAVYYHDQLLKIIAKMVPEREIYAYVVGKRCNRCQGTLKYNDWCPNCHGKQVGTEILEPYFSATGCRLALKLVGAKWEEAEMLQDRYDGKEGPYIIFQLWVTVTPRRGEPVRTMGSRSTADDFFSKRYRWDDVLKKRVPYRLPLEEVNVRNVQLGAISHAFNRGLKDIGFMPTAQHLIDAGVKLTNLKRIQFGRGGDEGEEFAESTTPPSAPQGGGGSMGSPPPAKPGVRTAKGIEDVMEHAANRAASPVAERTPAPSSKPLFEAETPVQGPPKSNIPPDPFGQGLQKKIDFVKWTPKGNGLAVTLADGTVYYCFDNRKMGEDGVKLFDVLINGQGQMATFVTKKSKSKDGEKEYTNITALLQLGDKEWLEDGTPVIRRDTVKREPGEEG